MKTHRSWHWPDRTIGKRESRELREEHNRLYNDYHRAYVHLHNTLEELSALLDELHPGRITHTEGALIDDARAFLAQYRNP